MFWRFGLCAGRGVELCLCAAAGRRATTEAGRPNVTLDGMNQISSIHHLFGGVQLMCFGPQKSPQACAREKYESTNR